MPDVQPNTSEARTTTGEIKDQSTPTTAQTQTSDQTSTTTDQSLLNTDDKKADPKVDTKAEDKSLLNKDDKKPASGAPEKYEPFKAPEGYELDPKAVEEFTPIAKELGLSQDGAQKLIDFYSAKTKEVAEAPYNTWKEMNDKWAGEVKADPALGPRLAEVKQNVSRALDAIGDPKLTSAFKEAMDLTGAGNHPAFVKVIDRLAAHFIEGKHVAGGGPSPHGQTAPGSKPQSVASALYPNLP